MDERSQSDGDSEAGLTPSKTKRGRTGCSVDGSIRGWGRESPIQREVIG